MRAIHAAAALVFFANVASAEEPGIAAVGSPLEAVPTTPEVFPRPIHFDAALLRDVVERELGDDERSSCSLDQGALFVHGTEEGLERARAVLEQLRAAAGRRVSLEVAAYRMT